MSLSKDLISQFVKATKDATTVKKESTVYGTVVKYNEKTYVKIDGSDLLTPAETLSSVEEGERVSIMIKDHTATITGNYTAPSASSIKVDGMEADLNANTANIKNLIAKNAEIENLVASKANIEDLTAANAEIDTLKANYAEIETLVADKASIGDLEAVNADIKSLKADKADIAHLEANYATIGSLQAVYADITRLEADKANIGDLTAINADIQSLKADKADIIDLTATNANIEVLTGKVADITTLINGNLTSDNIQSLNLTSANTTIENALIKDAMIDSVSANKINAGVINTNNVSIQSDDGSMLLQGNLQQFKDENGNVRIQIGKDATGNFTFVLYDENGTGQLINQNGIQSSNAIADGLIVDAKVAENANISGSKLDITSLFSEMNNSTETLKSTRIYLDDKNQTLDIAFNTLSNTVENIVTDTSDLDTIRETLETNTTNISVVQGEISTLITNTTITKEDGTVIQLKDAYNSTVDTVDSHTATIGYLETNLATAESNIKSVISKQTEFEQDLNGFKTTVSSTYQTKDDMNNYSTTDAMNSAIDQKADSILSTVSATYVTQSSFTNLSNNLENNYSTTETMNSAIDQKANEILSTVSSTYAEQTTVTNLSNNLSNNYSTTAQMNSAIDQKSDSILSTVSTTYATQKTVTDLSDNLLTNYSTTETINSSIDQKADSILSTVSSTYATKSDIEKSLKSVTNEYYISTSITELIDGSWSTTVPKPETNKYIWRREKSEFVDGSITYGDPVCLTNESNDGYTIMLTKDTITCLWNNSDNPGGDNPGGGGDPGGGDTPNTLTISTISSKSIIETAAFGINYTTNKTVSKHYISWNATSSSPTYTDITSYVSSSGNSHQYLENNNTQAIGTYNVAIKVETSDGESKVSNIFTITITASDSGDTNLLNGITLVNAYFNNNTGEVVTSGASITTGSFEDYIPVTAGATYTFNCDMNGASISHFRYGWYDSSKTYMTYTTLYNAPPFDITIADGASYIRFHIVTDADHTYNSIANMSLTLKNSSSSGGSDGTLSGSYLFYGDSICYGGGTGGYGYPQAFAAQETACTAINYGTSGSCISKNDTYDVKYPSILSKIQGTTASTVSPDYICLEGGVNDSWGNRNPLGTFKGGTAPTTTSGIESYMLGLNEYEFCDALEKCICEIKLKWPSKGIFYLIPHKINTSYSTPYFTQAISICNKWNIPVIDIRNSGLEGSDLLSTYTTDNTHPNRDGYVKYYVPTMLEVFKANR